MNAVETRALTRHFGARTAVDALDLTVGEGELFALLGVNGAGKTTAIRMLCCLTRPTSGDALVMGRSVVRESAAVKALINLSPQESATAPNLSVRENLELCGGIYGLGRTEARRRADAFMADFGLGEAERQRARTLSGGQQRRLSIAMALISDPRVLFLDEPTLGLDVLARRELWRSVERLKGRATILLTTHYLEEAEALSDRVAVMEKGRLRAVGTPGQLVAQTGAKDFESAFIALAAEGAELE